MVNISTSDAYAQASVAPEAALMSDDPLVRWIGQHGQDFSACRSRDLNDFSESPSLYLIRDGWVLRYRAVNEDELATVATYIPGDIVNLECVVNSGSTDALVAHSRIEGIRAPCQALKLAIEDSPALSFSVMRRFLAESNWLREALAAVGQLKAQDRLIFYIAQTRERMILYGMLEKGSSTFAMPLTQEQLARTIGVSLVHLNRVLNHRTVKRIIIFNGGRVFIPDIASFEKRVANILGN